MSVNHDLEPRRILLLTDPRYVSNLRLCLGDKYSEIDCPIKKGDTIDQLWQTLTPADETDAQIKQNPWPPPPTMLTWANYEHIIVQDKWVVDPKDPYAVIPAGAFLATCDIYERANTRTIKTILEVDSHDPDLENKLDPKKLATWFSMSDPAFFPQMRNRRALSDSPATDPTTVLEPSAEQLSHIECLAKYVLHNVNLIIVEDEFSHLQHTCVELGIAPPVLPDKGAVYIYFHSAGGSGGSAEPCDHISQLVQKIQGNLQGLKENKKHTILITDILFRDIKEFNGLDLIGRLRQCIRPADLGVIVRSRFDAASVMMSALRRGADLFVEKDAPGHQTRITHRHLPSLPQFRLVAALAEIAMQKHYINRARWVLETYNGKYAERILRDIGRVFDTYAGVTSLMDDMRMVLSLAYNEIHYPLDQNDERTIGVL